jgi:hypothetical protein
MAAMAAFIAEDGVDGDGGAVVPVLGDWGLGLGEGVAVAFGALGAEVGDATGEVSRAVLAVGAHGRGLSGGVVGQWWNLKT